jgi:hypothetical protein
MSIPAQSTPSTPLPITTPLSLSASARSSAPSMAIPLGPVPRYAALSVVYKGDIYLHGGDDGGASLVTKAPSYTHQIFSDIWHFCTHTNKWTRVPIRTTHPSPSKLASLFSSPAAPSVADLAHPPPPPGSPAPPLARAQHAGTVIGDILYVFGGLGYRPLNNERRFRPLADDDDHDNGKNNAPSPNDNVGSAGVYDTNEMWMFDWNKLVWIEMHFDSTIPRM